jgi:hypothetical protein
MLLVAWTAQAQSQAPQPGPEHKTMLVWVGDWTFEEETRDSASEPWYKTPVSCQVRTILGGFAVEMRCKASIKGKQVDFLEIETVDPVKKTNVTSFFGSDGTSGHVTSATYVGNKEEVKYTSMAADGKTFEARCNWTFGAGSMSMSGACDRLTDGKWVPFRKLTGTKARLP